MLKRYLQFVKPYTMLIILTILIGILKFGIPLLIPLLIKYVIDDVIQNGAMSIAEKKTALMNALLLFGFIFVVIRPPVEYYRQYLAQWTSNKILYDIRKKLYKHLQALSVRFYSNNKVGEIISRVINDVESTKDFIVTGLMNVWLDLVTILIALAIMFTMSVKLTLISLIVFPFYMFSIYYFFGNLRKLTRLRSQSLAEVQGFLHERVQGMTVIKTFAIEEEENERFNKRNLNFLKKATDHTKWNAKSFAVINTITDIGPLLVVGFGALLVIDNTLTVGSLAAFIAYLDRLYGPLRRLVSSSTTLTQSLASMDRMFHLFDEPYDVKDEPHAKDYQIQHGDIAFKQVSFKYNKEDSEVLHNINLDIKSGETVAFVGMSGGGKSTMISLIPRFYDVTSGEIMIDNIALKDYRIESLRSQIGMVMQDNILFSESIRENILLGKPDATEEEMIYAAKLANAHEFIMSLPDGYDTEVGERGVKLSGGQKQRVAISRVFLKNPPILILDEATSALDLESEAVIQEALETLSKDRTTVIVAHRLSTITHADKIVVIQNGEIAEIGTHQQLMNNKSHYYNLYSIQHLDAE